MVTSETTDAVPLGYPPSSYAARRVTAQGDIAELTYDILDAQDRIRIAIDSVRRPDAGAVAIFLGTTRDHFKGKEVTRLEYQAYTPLALKSLVHILDGAHSLATDGTESHARIKSIVVHRLGDVPVGSTSVIIAVSSPHRFAAFQACEWLLERVKDEVQIWKREWYASSSLAGHEEGPLVGRDGQDDELKAVWKKNA